MLQTMQTLTLTGKQADKFFWLATVQPPVKPLRVIKQPKDTGDVLPLVTDRQRQQASAGRHRHQQLTKVRMLRPRTTVQGVPEVRGIVLHYRCQRMAEISHRQRHTERPAAMPSGTLKQSPAVITQPQDNPFGLPVFAERRQQPLHQPGLIVRLEQRM